MNYLDDELYERGIVERRTVTGDCPRMRLILATIYARQS